MKRSTLLSKKKRSTLLSKKRILDAGIDDIEKQIKHLEKKL
jgi:hypothetical protein